MDKEIVISIKTVLVAFTFVALVWVFIKIVPIILALFVSLILALTLTPLVDWGQKRKIPRGISTFFLFIGILIIFGSVGAAIVKPVANQTRKLIELFPRYLDTLFSPTGFTPFSDQFGDALVKQFTRTSGDVLRATLGAFSSALFILSIFVFTFYMLAEFDQLKKMFVDFFSEDRRKRVEKLVLLVEKRLGVYLRGQLLLGLIVGLMTYVGLYLLRIDYALSLALIAGVLEIVPVIGPILSMIPALIVASGTGLLTFSGVLGLYILVQQLENNLLVPKVMEKAVGFNPLVTLVLLLIGGTLFGILGMILAIPSALVAYLVISDLLEWK